MFFRRRAWTVRSCSGRCAERSSLWICSGWHPNGHGRAADRARAAIPKQVIPVEQTPPARLGKITSLRSARERACDLRGSGRCRHCLGHKQRAGQRASRQCRKGPADMSLDRIAVRADEAVSLDGDPRVPRADRERFSPSRSAPASIFASRWTRCDIRRYLQGWLRCSTRRHDWK